MATAELMKGLLDRRWIPLAVLVVSASGLGLFLLLDPASSDEAVARDRELLPGFRAAGISSFSVTRGQETVRFARRGEGTAAAERGWWIETAPGGRADDSLIEQLLAEVEYARLDRRPQSGKEAGKGAGKDAIDAARAGLEPARVIFDSPQGGFRLGAADPIGRGSYVRRADGAIGVTAARLSEMLERSFEEGALRARSLVAVSLLEAHAINIDKSGNTLGLARSPDGSGWRMVRPYPARTDAARVEALVTALRDVPAARVLAAAPAQIAPSSGYDNIVVSIDDHERARALGRCPAAANASASPEEEVLFRRWDGVHLCYPAAPLSSLLRAPLEYRELRPWPLVPSEVASITMQEEGGRLTLARTAAGWRMRVGDAGADQPADEDEIHELLEALASVPGDPAPGPVTSPPANAARLGGTTRSGDRLELAVAVTKPMHLLLVRDQERDPIAVRHNYANFLHPDPLRFRPRRVLSLRAADIRRIVTPEATVARSGTSWILEKSDRKLDDAALDRLLAALAELRAERFGLPEAIDGARRITVEQEGAKPLTLQVGAGAHGCRAHLGDDPVTIVLGDAACRDLHAPLSR